MNKDSISFEKRILNEIRFNQFFKKHGFKNRINEFSSPNIKLPHAYNKKKIQNELTRVRAQMNRLANQRIFYMISKAAQHVLEGLYIDVEGLNRVKELSYDRKTRIVMLPVYKSYADPLILYYINYLKNMDLGFTFGHLEDSPNSPAVENVLKRIGCFLIKRK